MARAQCNLALCYEVGRGVTKDLALAHKLYEKAAQSNYPEALYNLALTLQQQPQSDDARVATLFAAAAAQELQPAMYNYAMCLLDGRGVSQNEAAGAKILRAAAEKGLAVAQCNLGMCVPFNLTNLILASNLLGRGARRCPRRGCGVRVVHARCHTRPR